jgi:hypothetical protein
MWQQHVTAIKQLFLIPDESVLAELKLGSIGPQVDAVQLNQDIQKATTAVNRAQIKLLRIVGLGIGSSPAVSEALESLIRCWNIPPGEREVLFIALGESLDFHYLNFCKSLCLNQIVKCLHYYNTLDYNNFGFLNAYRSPGIGLGGLMGNVRLPPNCNQQ